MSRPWQDSDVLRKLYVKEGLTTTEIGDRLGCGEGTVWRWLDKHDIDRRNKGPKRNYPELEDRDWLRTEYIEKQRTAYDIADELGCSDVNVYYWMEKHGIETRSEQPIADERLRNREWLHRQIVEEGRTYVGMAKNHELTAGAIRYWACRHGIEYPTDEDKPYYGPNWKEQRKKRLKKDGHKCVACGMTQSDHRDEYDVGLTVHHITPLHEFLEDGEIDYEQANGVDNLISVCRACHGKWEGIPLKPANAD